MDVGLDVDPQRREQPGESDRPARHILAHHVPHPFGAACSVWRRHREIEAASAGAHARRGPRLVCAPAGGRVSITGDHRIVSKAPIRRHAGGGGLPARAPPSLSLHPPAPSPDLQGAAGRTSSAAPMPTLEQRRRRQAQKTPTRPSDSLSQCTRVKPAVFRPTCPQYLVLFSRIMAAVSLCEGPLPLGASLRDRGAGG